MQPMSRIDIENILNQQLMEITGSTSGFVRSAVDQLIEEFSVMAQQGRLNKGVDYTWVNPRRYTAIDILAIPFNKVFPAFKIYASQTKYEGELLDKDSCKRLFEGCEYIIDRNKVVKYERGMGQNQGSARSLIIDVKSAIAAGLEMEGFQKD